jgi:hypothetical protein
MSIARGPIMPDRVRTIRGHSFAFVPHRFLRDGFFCSLSCDELRLYLFLVLAADREGISFYAFDRICSALEMCLDDFLEARNGLLDKDLVAFDGTRFQVLSLPPRPVRRCCRALRSEQQLENDDPATVRKLLLESLASTEPSK